MTDQIEVTQADIDIAAEYNRDWPQLRLTAAFAKHRLAHAATGKANFQSRVQPWMMACFGPEISADKVERCDRFLEESLELVQAVGYSAERAHALVEYVFGRPVGEPAQEVGGVMVTLAALCLPCDLDMHDAGETELARINQPEIIGKIRAKQAAKPTGSALPIPMLADQLGWQSIETAPKDGTAILAWCLHPYASSMTQPDDYVGPVVARWIDHNGGGWTWHGHLGNFTHWMPLPTAPDGAATA